MKAAPMETTQAAGKRFFKAQPSPPASPTYKGMITAALRRAASPLYAPVTQMPPKDFGGLFALALSMLSLACQKRVWRFCAQKQPLRPRSWRRRRSSPFCRHDGGPEPRFKRRRLTKMPARRSFPPCRHLLKELKSSSAYTCGCQGRFFRPDPAWPPTLCWGWNP